MRGSSDCPARCSMGGASPSPALGGTGGTGVRRVRGGGLYLAGVCSHATLGQAEFTSNRAVGGTGGCGGRGRVTRSFSGGAGGGGGGAGGAARGGGLYVGTGTMDMTGATLQGNAARGGVGGDGGAGGSATSTGRSGGGRWRGGAASGGGLYDAASHADDQPGRLHLQPRPWRRGGPGGPGGAADFGTAGGAGGGGGTGGTARGGGLYVAAGTLELSGAAVHANTAAGGVGGGGGGGERRDAFGTGGPGGGGGGAGAPRAAAAWTMPRAAPRSSQADFASNHALGGAGGRGRAGRGRGAERRRSRRRWRDRGHRPGGGLYVAAGTLELSGSALHANAAAGGVGGDGGAGGYGRFFSGRGPEAQAQRALPPAAAWSTRARSPSPTPPFAGNSASDSGGGIDNAGTLTRHQRHHRLQLRRQRRLRWRIVCRRRRHGHAGQHHRRPRTPAGARRPTTSPARSPRPARTT